MKWLAMGLLLVSIVAVLLTAVGIDTPTALFVLAAWTVVCVCGGAPVAFGVFTRRAEQRRIDLEEAEELGGDD